MAINPSSAIGVMNAAYTPGLDGAIPLSGAVPLSGAGAAQASGPMIYSGGDTGASFESALSFIDQAAAKESAATSLQTAFAQGKDVPLHQVMAASEEASIALETLATLRDRVLDAVNDLTKMQI